MPPSSLREGESKRAAIQWRAHGFCVAYVLPENFFGIKQIQSVLPVRSLVSFGEKVETGLQGPECRASFRVV